MRRVLNQTLRYLSSCMPAFDGSDDFVGIGGPCEGLGHLVGLLDGPANDLVGAEPLGREQNDPGAPHVLLRRVAILTRAQRRRRSAAKTVTEIPLRMRKTRTRRHRWESQQGFSR